MRKSVIQTQMIESLCKQYSPRNGTVFTEEKTICYLEENGNCNDYNTINGFIHNLYSVIDICGFKKDNRKRQIRSSRLDIEHLLYASVADLFLTKDVKLRCRAKNIFGVLGKNILCPDI